KHGVGLMCQPGFAMVPAAEQAGIPVYREGFADRLLLPDGRLAPRTRPDAMLPPDEAARQAVTLAKSGTVDTICVHGDTPNAGAIATFLAVGPGVHFAADASVGILAGAVSQAAFALAYAWMALRFGWTWCVAAATVAFALATLVLDAAPGDAAVTLVLAAAALVL